MKSSPDPSVHRNGEQQFIQHVQRLLEDDRLRLDTTHGRRPVTSLIRSVSRADHGVELKRLMSEMNLPDRELQARMPVGESLKASLSRRRFLFLKQVVGRLHVLCVSPTRALLAGQTPQPLTLGEVQKLLGGAPPGGGVPTTLVLLSTSGFTLDAHELTDRRAERTVILAEPNDAGGWNLIGPAEMKALVDLFDPEAEADKRERIRAQVQAGRAELLSGGLAADRLAAKAQLPLQLIEQELKSYAKEHPGLIAKRLDGRVVLFTEGTAPKAGPAGSSSSTSSGGTEMPLLDRFRALFARKGDNEKKIAVLSERRAALTQQRDRAYDDIATLEKKEAELRREFRSADGVITKRRVTTQLLQLRKDIERRQQLVSVLNQQANIVGTHLHDLELVQQGQTARLPDSEELARDAAAAEDMLAQLEADSELAGSVGAIAHGGMTAEEQTLYEELEREGAAAPPQAQPSGSPQPAARAAQPQASSAARTTPAAVPPARPAPQAGESEPG